MGRMVYHCYACAKGRWCPRTGSRRPVLGGEFCREEDAYGEICVRLEERCRRVRRLRGFVLPLTHTMATVLGLDWEGRFPYMSKLSKPNVGDQGEASPGGPTAPCPWLAKAAPTVWEYLVEATWGDATSRKTSTLMIVPEDGVLKVGLHERNFDLWLWATGETLQAAVRGLETRLTGSRVDWRPSKQQGGKKPR